MRLVPGDEPIVVAAHVGKSKRVAYPGALGDVARERPGNVVVAYTRMGRALCTQASTGFSA